MDLRFVRVGFIIISALLGSQVVGESAGWPIELRALLGAAAGAVLVLIEAFIHRVGRVSVRGFSAAVFGLLFGLIMAKLVSDAVALIPLDLGTTSIVRVVLTWAFCYLGMAMALRGRDEFNVIIPYVRLARHDRGEESYLIDTSAIIDGRIVDLCRTRFVEGRLVIPRFVLKELQMVADSTDPTKRSRGRRGLEVLNQLRQLNSVDVRIHEEDLPGIAETDAKLVRLGQMLGTRVVTNDYNLNKIAEFQNVGVLNVNELAQALRPVVLPGETLEVKPIKEGKEHHQAVAYLDDGTMVVVENGRALIGQTIRGLVTSVLQTAAGRMVFVRPENAPPKH
ncbi:MAG: PIN domain nuclease [Candidatus Omnitrophica bacterium]|nr:PIN domain nuclease [Candidatus Omnitrophota bacterium]